MRKTFEWILNNQKTMIAIYVIAIVVCAICYPFIGVNYSLADYLPPGTNSTDAISLMEQEYTQGIPNCRVMISDITIPEALEIEAQLKACPHIKEVTWLDANVDITVPLEFADQSTVETYYKDGSALFTLTINNEDKIVALEEVKAVVGEDAVISGEIASMAEGTTTTMKEVPLIAAGGILFAMVVLIFTTDAYVLSPMVMIGLGVAVVLNAGSNIIFGSVSFITDAAGSILQMAVSLDYSVFLIHRWDECKAQGLNSKDAMLEAMCKSLPSISASGLTTVIGFIALIFMRFRLGADLGLALAKGVAISLVVVFTFMPIFVLKMEKWIKKTEHRKLLPSFAPFAEFISRLRRPALIVFAVIIIPTFIASRCNNYYYGSSHMFNEHTTLGKNVAATEAVFGQSDTYVLMVPKDSTASQQALSDELHTVPRVTDILSYVDTVGAEVPKAYLDKATLSLLDSEKYTRLVISVDVPFEGEETFETVDRIRDVAEKHYPGSWYLAGEGVSTRDLKTTIVADDLWVNLVAIAAIFLVLLLTFKSKILPVILVFSIETAIWTNLTVPFIFGRHVFYLAYLLVSSIQLGSTVDYAILFTDRYLELRSTMHPLEASKEVVDKCSLSILSSGSVLLVMGCLMGLISTNGIISQMGYFIGFGALLSLVITVFVLPGELVMFDALIRRTTKGTENWLAEGESAAAAKPVVTPEKPPEEKPEFVPIPKFELNTDTKPEPKETNEGPTFSEMLLEYKERMGRGLEDGWKKYKESFHRDAEDFRQQFEDVKERLRAENFGFKKEKKKGYIPDIDTVQAEGSTNSPAVKPPEENKQMALEEAIKDCNMEFLLLNEDEEENNGKEVDLLEKYF